ncbi:MAG: penicillin-binding transpeptidase domain-containing protein [Candidatus Krumholzibacteria bacterium]|nr:penicillin-binding transpeptidase domain-containing protein [Candidatus Krumholzibacteria bacterium]
MSELYPRHRLNVLSIAVTVVIGVIVYRLIELQIVDHERYIAKAKRQWYVKHRIPARRGNIFDRNGFPLAVMHWTYTVGVTPRSFSVGDKKAVACLAEACDMSKNALRRRLARDDAYVQLGRDLHLTEDQFSKLSTLSGVRVDPNHDRLYPYEAMPPQLVGAINEEGSGTAGIELAFQSILAGEDGWLLESQLPGDPRGFQPVNAPGRKPRDGNDIYLTIDTRIQSIVDFELEQAIDRYGARGGMAIVVEPETGDVLAISEKPTREISRVASKAEGFALRSVNCIYEPGSTFKLITDSYLLESGKVDPYDAFYGENGEAHFDFGTFHDDHEFGWLTFKESFVHSSNICTIKAALGTRNEDFYRHILRFGFGGRTGIDLPAESRGTLREPGIWSSRSLPSIAIGHEVGVTAVQMAMAYCAVANGGNLLVPRIALEARDAKGSVIDRFPPVMVRRVLSEGTARMMRDFCKEVVLKGTGMKAAVNGVEVAGKTGTSQKVVSGTYQKGKYVVSFAGFTPTEEPRIVCLVVLDEPVYPYYWGGESSAIVFSKIVEGINLSTDLFYNAGTESIAMGKARGERKRVPSFLRLTAEAATDLAADCGLAVQCPKAKGIVYSQIPDPGTYVDRGEEIKLMIRAAEAQPKEPQRVPGVAGLSIREARRLLLACGLDCIVRGFGIVERQDPAAGSFISRTAKVILYCNPRSSAETNEGVQIADGAGH